MRMADGRFDLNRVGHAQEKSGRKLRFQSKSRTPR
jgi:hypothetical protein